MKTTFPKTARLVFLSALFALIVACGQSANAGVSITSPANGASVSSPIHVVASATSTHAITAMRIYLDNVSVYFIAANSLNTYVSAAAGTHNLVVQAWDSAGAVTKTASKVTVGTAAGGVTVTAPVSGATIASPVPVAASAKSSSSAQITAMAVYVDNTLNYSAYAPQINTSVTMAAGGHNVVVQAWDSTGTVYQKAVSVNVGSSVPVTPSTGRQWYVEPTGSNNSSCGSSSAPCATINYVNTNRVAPGDTVHVAGTFTLNSSTCISTTTSGTSSAYITYVADPAGSAHINGNGACFYMWHNLANYVKILGFDFTGVQTSSNTNSGTEVILSEAGSGNVEVAYNTVHDLPSGFSAAIDVAPWGTTNYTGAPCTVHDNILYNLGYSANLTQGNYGLYISCGTNSYVYNNLIYNAGSIGIAFWHSANHMHVYNNTIVNAKYIGISVGTGDQGGVSGAVFDVTNNIVANSGYGIMVENGTPGYVSTSSIFRNNLIYNNQTDWYFNNNGTDSTIQAGGMSVTGTVAANPLFAAAGSGNYRLGSGSPAIGKGLNVGLNHDLDGNPVPSVTGINIGAY